MEESEGEVRLIMLGESSGENEIRGRNESDKTKGEKV